MENNESKSFCTRDLYLAATLVTLRFPLLHIDYQQEGNKPNPVGYFNFDESESLQEAVNNYRQGLVTVEPKSFVTNMRSIKAEINNFYKNPYKAENQPA